MAEQYWLAGRPFDQLGDGDAAQQYWLDGQPWSPLDAGGAAPTSLTGATGGTVEAVGGTGGTIEAPQPASVTGTAGGTVEAIGGTGSLGTVTALTGATGGTVEAVGGTGGGIAQSLTGLRGGTVEAAGGSSGAIFTARTGCTFFIAGVDRTQWVELGVRRNVQSGSRGTLEMHVNNVAGNFDTQCGDEVVVYVGAYRFFGGIVDAIDEVDPSGTSTLIQTTLSCVDYGALLDRRIVGTFYEVIADQNVQVIASRLVREELADLGITYGGDHFSTPWIRAQYFNWMPASQVLNKACDAAGYDWVIDAAKTLYVYAKNTGFTVAPFTISTNDGNWRSMRVRKTRARKANRVGVRNSRDLKPLWTDTFTSDGATVNFAPTRAILHDRPVVRLNGVALNVTELGTWAPGWQCWYVPDGYGIFFATPPAAGTLEVIYPSPLSYVVWAEDAADIAVHGRWDYLEEARDFADIASMEGYAAALLARMEPEPVELEIETDRLGLEPGQLLSVTTSRPAVDGDFIITSVSSEEIGKASGPTPQPGGFFRHVVRATNDQTRRIKSNVDLFNRIADLARQPKDRVGRLIGFGLAETIEGIENPGLTTGLKPPVRIAETDGVLVDCSLFFRSVNDGSPPPTLTTDDINIDVLQNGESIFAGSTFMLFPAGATEPQRQFIFRSDPVVVTKGDVFTVQVITADSKAYDGVLQLRVLG